MRRDKRRLAAVVAMALLGALAAAPSASAEITPLLDFGTGGGGAGELNFPTGLTFDPSTGDVGVGDKYNNRLDQFTPGGSFIRAFGWDVIDGTAPGTGLQTCTTATGCQTGTSGLVAGGFGAGQFDRAAGVAADSSGNLYAVNKEGERVEEFTSSGDFIRAFGWDVIAGASPDTGLQVCTIASGCQKGSAGGEAGELNGPRAIAIDSAGTVYVMDEFNQRVSEFTPSGGFIRAFGWDVVGGTVPGTGLQVCTAAPPGCRPGSNGGAAGELSNPRGVSIDGSGNVDVADTGNERIDEFTPAGDFVRGFGLGVVDGSPVPQVCTTGSGCQSGTTGTGDAGELYNPYGVAADSSGDLFATELGNNRVSEFTASGDFVRAFGWDVIDGTTAGTGFQVCTAGSGCQAGTDGSGFGQLSQAESVAVDCRGAVYVGDTFPNERITRFADPGTPLGPCPVTPPPPSPTALDFSFGKLKKNKKKGTVTVVLNVPAAGTVVAGDANDSGVARASASARKLKIRRITKVASAAGAVKLTLRTTRRAHRKLKRTGKLKAVARFAYTATGHPTAAHTRKITFVLRLRR